MPPKGGRAGRAPKGPSDKRKGRKAGGGGGGAGSSGARTMEDLPAPGARDDAYLDNADLRALLDAEVGAAAEVPDFEEEEEVRASVCLMQVQAGGIAGRQSTDSTDSAD